MMGDLRHDNPNAESWEDVRDGYLVWRFQGVAQVYGFEFRLHPDGYRPDERTLAPGLSRFVNGTNLEGLRVGNVEHLAVAPIPIGVLFGPARIYLPTILPGIDLALHISRAPSEYLWQVRPIARTSP